MSEEKPKKKRRSKLAVEVNEEEYTKLLGATDLMHHKIAFMLAWESGFRISEIINLKPEDIDVKNNRIRINNGKGGKDRIVPLPKNWHQDHLKFLPMPCGVRSLQSGFYKSAEKAGITFNKPTVHVHSLRHGFATHCLRKGVNIRSIQRALGHSNLATTSIYLRLSPEEMLDEIKFKAHS